LETQALKTIEGKLVGTKKKFAIVASRFNDFITKRLAEGAVDALVRHGVKESDIMAVWVPGSFEIPIAAQRIAKKRAHDAIICLGTILKGDTPHFDYVAGEVAKGIASVSLASGIPVIFGIITAENLEQAVERAGTKHGNKGAKAAEAAIEMANTMEQL
jgi:6,7-dimethyl-8-ribityllumazine synthase